jgi:Spx/MgsR family transcriptional regulator
VLHLIFKNDNQGKWEYFKLIRVYGVPSCDKIRKTKTLFSSHDMDFEFINVRKKPLTRKQLQQVIKQLDLDNVINRKGMLYRKKGLKEKGLTADQLFEELLNEQGMIKRPLIEKGDQFIVGYDEKAILDFVKAK